MPTPFEFALAGVALAAVLFGRGVDASAPTARRALEVASVGFAFLVIRRCLSPDWSPRGDDWDSWIRTVVSWQSGLAGHPANRYPLWGAIVAGLARVSHVPQYLVAQLFNHACGACVLAGVYRLGARLGGAWAGEFAALATLLLPAFNKPIDAVGAYPLEAVAVTWVVVAAAENAAWSAAVCGLALAVCFGSVEKGIVPGMVLLPVVLWAARGWSWWGRTMVIIPVIALASAYAAFPVRLASIDALATAATPGAGFALTSTDGYVFGQAMGPAAWEATLAWVRERPLHHRLEFDVVWPGMSWVGPVALMAALVFTAVRSRNYRDVAGIGGGLLAAVPIGASVPSLRYLLPSTVLFPLPLISAASRLGVAGMAALGLAALLPGSPWRMVPTQLIAPQAAVSVAIAARVATLDVPVEIDVEPIEGVLAIGCANAEDWTRCEDPLHCPAPHRLDHAVVTNLARARIWRKDDMGKRASIGRWGEGEDEIVLLGPDGTGDEGWPRPRGPANPANAVPIPIPAPGR